MSRAVRIGVIGDFEPSFHSHWATDAALYSAASELGMQVELRWLPTETIKETELATWDGLIASPGSPYKSFDGMLRGIRFARERNRPFVGT